MDERIPRSTESSRQLPTTTSTVPSRMMPPMMRVFARLARRLRVAMRRRTFASPRADVPAMGSVASRHGGAHHLARRDAAVLDADDGAGVSHHLLVVGREDEG